MKKEKTVVIFGRPNVGKSTLFNRLAEQDRAIVSDIEGTTRDANEAEIEWRGIKMKLIDTGGILNIAEINLSKRKEKKEKKKETEFSALALIDRKVQREARDWIKKADAILFLVDSKTGLLPQDFELARFLKKTDAENRAILVANKSDSPAERNSAAEFYRLGLGEPAPVSAANGSGTGDLLDLVVKRIAGRRKAAAPKREKKEKPAINVLIVGKPNVGKSSLLNSLLKKEKAIVSPLAHTTREPVDEIVDYGGCAIRFVDTAGISRCASRERRRGKMELEKIGIEKTLKFLNQADVALLVVDLETGLEHQETKIAEEIIGRKKSLIIVGNKWDLIREKDAKKYLELVRYRLPFVAWAPIIFLSALNGTKINNLVELIREVNDARKITIDEKRLEKFLKRIVKIRRPVKGRGVKYPFVKWIKQIGENPPEFEVRIGSGETLDDSYIRFMENRLREEFKFLGAPITVRVKRK